MKVYRTIIQTTLFTLLSVGCASILGIEDAELAEDADGGASGSAGNGGSTSNGGSGGSGNAQTPCEQYCDTVMNNCTAEFGLALKPSPGNPRSKPTGAVATTDVPSGTTQSRRCTPVASLTGVAVMSSAFL